jgi:hypothetical protein
MANTGLNMLSAVTRAWAIIMLAGCRTPSRLAPAPERETHIEIPSQMDSVKRGWQRVTWVLPGVELELPPALTQHAAERSRAHWMGDSIVVLLSIDSRDSNQLEQTRCARGCMHWGGTVTGAENGIRIGRVEGGSMHGATVVQRKIQCSSEATLTVNVLDERGRGTEVGLLIVRAIHLTGSGICGLP